jgi:glyoxylase-like metal-dependent hydrolase (beta-lactamase superfamily II)
LVADPVTKKAAVIDPVLEFRSKRRNGRHALRRHEANEAEYSIKWVLETHAHADHLSGAPFVKARTGARIGIGEHIKDVQRIFRPVFNATDLAGPTCAKAAPHAVTAGQRRTEP